MKLSGIELRYLINEISKKTSDYYVSNIYGINAESLLFKLHHPKKPDVMLMFSTLGLWISGVKIEQTESNKLLKRLRNDLLRLRLTKVEQIGAERIVYLTFSGFDKEFVLVGEFFGNGNILLCNKEKKILALSHSIDVRHRKLHVGLEYSPPPQNAIDIFELKPEDLEEITSASLPAAKWFGRKLGLPTKYVEEIFRLAKIDSKTIGTNISKDDVKKIFDSLNEILNKVVNGIHEPIIIKDEEKNAVYPIKLGTEKNYSEVSSFMEGLDELFSEEIIEGGKETQASAVNKKIAELQNKLDEQNSAIIKVKEKSKEISNVANELLKLVSQGVSSFKDPKIIDLLKKHNSRIISEKGITLLKIHDEKMKINLDTSIHAIASNLFNEAKRQSAAINSIEKLKKKTEKEIEIQQKQVEITKTSITFSEVKKKNWFERYRWFYTTDGILAIGGRDSSSNSAIIRKHLEKNDKVFHADIYGSPFFILKNSDNATTATINEIAHATVCFSRAWREAMYGMSAYWVEPEQVKKAAPSGQYLPKGSFTIDGQRNFVKISSLKLAVGLLKQNESFLITCGPLDPIKKNCECYSVIEPSGSESSDVAKKIRTEFIKMKGEIIKNISLDDFVRVLPAGLSHVIESGLGNAAE